MPYLFWDFYVDLKLKAYERFIACKLGSFTHEAGNWTPRIADIGAIKKVVGSNWAKDRRTEQQSTCNVLEAPTKRRRPQQTNHWIATQLR